MERESFLFYRSYLEAIGKIKSIETRYNLLMGIINYGLDRTAPQFTDELSDMAWVFIEPLLDANYRNYVNGCKGGAPAEAMRGNQNARKNKPKTNPKQTQNEPNSNPKQTENKGNVNDNDNDNANENVNDNDNANVNVNVNVNVKEKERNPYIDINTMSISDFDKYDEWNREHGVEG